MGNDIDERRRSERVSIYLKPNEMDKLRQAADAAYEREAVFCRNAVLEKLAELEISGLMENNTVLANQS